LILDSNPMPDVRPQRIVRFGVRRRRGDAVQRIATWENRNDCGPQRSAERQNHHDEIVNHPERVLGLTRP